MKIYIYIYMKIYIKYRSLLIFNKLNNSNDIIRVLAYFQLIKVVICGVLAIICSNSFSHYKVDQKKTVAISQMFNHVQLNYTGCIY